MTRFHLYWTQCVTLQVMPASCFCLLIKYAKPPRTRLALEQHNPRVRECCAAVVFAADCVQCFALSCWLQWHTKQSQRTKPQKASSGSRRMFPRALILFIRRAWYDQNQFPIWRRTGTKSTGNKLSADLEKRKKAVLLAPGAASTIEDLDDIFTKIQAARRLKLWRQRLWLLYRAYTPQYFYFEAVEMVFQVLCFGMVCCTHSCLS